MNIPLSEPKRYLIAFLLVAALSLLVLGFCEVRFESNDDTGIMNVFSGQYSGEPSPDSVMSSYSLGLIISTLYKVIDTVPWYPLAHLGVIFVALALICKSLIKLFEEKGYHVGYALSAFTVIYAGFFMHSNVVLQFSTTPSYAGAAAIMLVLAAWHGETRLSRRTDFICALLLIILAFMFRKSSGQVVAAIFALAIVLKIALLLRSGSEESAMPWRKKRILKLALYTALVFGAVGCLETLQWLHYNQPEWKIYHVNNMQRALYMDYAHPAYEERGTKYEAIGLDQDLHGLVNEWFFLDKRMAEGRLFSNMNEIGFEELTPSPLSRIREAGFTLASTLRSYPHNGVLEAMALFTLFALSATVFGIHYSRQKGIRVAAALIVHICFTGMLAVLCIKGRMPPRAFYATLIPSSTLLIYVGYLSIPKKSNAFRIHRGQAIVCSILTLIMVLLAISSAYHSVLCSNDPAYLIRANIKESINRYTRAHPNEIYIVDNSASFPIDPFAQVQNRSPKNLFFWGGVLAFSPTYKEKLTANSLNHLYSDAFMQTRIKFISYNKPSAMLEKYMWNLFKAKSRIIDTVELSNDSRFVIYQFSPAFTTQKKL